MTPLFMKVLYVVVTVFSTAFVIVGCFAQTRYPPDEPVRRHPRVKSLVAVPAFRLFPPNAAISLTDDNSTFFLARPAAFGPELAENGLSAVLWIGAGFGEDDVEPQGELGCSDVPGWDGKRAADGAPVLPSDDQLDDGTDNYLESFSRRHKRRKTPRAKVAAAAPPATGTTHTANDRAATTTPLVPEDAVNTEKADSKKESSQDHDKAKANKKANNNDKKAKAAKSSTKVENKAEAAHHGNIQSLQEGAEIAGKIVLLRRGGCGFLAKVMWAQRRGAVAVIVGDDRKGGPLIQMYASGDTSDVHIPSVFTAHTTAHLLTALAAAAARDDETLIHKNPELVDIETETETKTEAEETPQATDSDWFWKTKKREWVMDDYVPEATVVATTGTGDAPALPTATDRPGPGDGNPSHGELWVTIAPARGGLPLIDTLLVVVASPLLAIVTITVVLLFVRSQCRHRAWRAPKAVVAQLPVHTFTPPGAPAPAPTMVPVGYDVASPLPSRPASPEFQPEPSITTPLLQRPRSRTTTGVPADEMRVMMRIPAPPPAPPSRYHQAECVVCLEEYVAGDRVMSLPCGHQFHASCITPWLTTRRRTCPICKGDVVRAAQSDA